MPRGGKRPGAGRKPGMGWLPEKKNRLPYITDAAMRKKLRELSPLDVMVKTMHAFLEAGEILGKDIVKIDEKIVTQLEFIKRAAEVAKDAAPYVHAKMATKLEHAGPDGGPMEHKIIAEIVSGGAVK